MQTKNEIIIKTKDEGTGILINLELTKRNGITNITNRVEILNGIIEIISPKGKGLEYLIKIPISDEK
jgi:signal transduction histidine kinase